MRQDSPLGGLQNEINAFSPHGYRLPFQILGDSAGTAKTIEDVLPIDFMNRLDDKGRFDLIMIDAGHLYSEIKADAEAWKDKVKPGGYILFHDYDSVHWADVANYLDNEFSQYKEFHKFMLADTLMIYYKKHA
jgi:hypothetical protein